MPKVSVIIPVYNVEQYLERCLDSVCNQTLKDIEIICVNDCSTDNSLQILQEYAAKDSRIRVIDLDKNIGEAAVRNLAFEEIKSEYFGFVDSDDTIDKNFYEVLYNNAEKCDADISKGVIVKYDSDKQEWLIPEWSALNSEIQKNIACFINSHTTAIYKTQIIKAHSIKYHEGIHNLVDSYFLLQVIKYAKKFVSTDDVRYYYYTTPNSVSNRRTLDTFKNTIEGVKVDFELLNHLGFDSNSYMPMFKYLVRVVVWRCANPFMDDYITTTATKTLLMLFEKCLYKEEFLINYFTEKKNLARKEILTQLRRNIK